MNDILIIGIGAGDPDYLTTQAIKALNRADVFFILDKGEAKDKLIALRRLILDRYIAPERHYRVLETTNPERERNVADYDASIDSLNRDKQAVFEQLLGQLQDGETGAFLVWGDPSLYDSTIRILDGVIASGMPLDYEVIPGITSVQALTARHRIPLNQIGRAVQITTGRRLREGWPEGVDSVVVMLDAGDSYRHLIDEDLHIYWGAYVGTPDEILIAGKLAEVAERIATTRAAAREANGWIMDSYLLRRGGREA
ncbi:precorrin-6A synthase (deacetylating) [Pseudomonas fulva]|uniref:precorrin-6A synthase (deacetylating) n=1 Tax=Pseudomonas fulva TaxID=47880 RepID=UPI00201D9FD6|nr:precorrin-6A synthase (deacetylating) [Pseudomonas fulva]UQY35002.1 precorrin-6A synthase (deacetylating) [Pseudomonas fulva]